MGGIVWMATFYLGTAIWPEHNPFVDDHFVYAIVLVGLILANAGRYYGLGKVWQRVGFVQDRPLPTESRCSEEWTSRKRGRKAPLPSPRADDVRRVESGGHAPSVEHHGRRVHQRAHVDIGMGGQDHDDVLRTDGLGVQGQRALLLLADEAPADERVVVGDRRSLPLQPLEHIKGG